MTPSPPRRQRALAPSPPPVAERLHGALLGLWLGNVMGMAMAGRSFPLLPAFPKLYEKPPAVGPPKPHPRGHGPALGFAACGAGCLLQAKQFQLGTLFKAYGQYAAFLQKHPQASQLPPEAALARALEAFPRFFSAEAFLQHSVRAPVASPVMDGVLLRSLPAACFFYADSVARVQAVTEEAAASQTGALGAMACVALAALVSEAVLSPGEGAPLAKLLEAMHRDMAQAAPRLADMGLRPAAVQQALALLEEDMAFAPKECPNLYSPALNLRQHGGQLRPTFRLALWALWHAPSSNPGCVIEDVVRRGGSPASQGALLAALCGARWGKGCLPNPGLEPLAPLVAKPPPPCGDASLLVALAQVVSPPAR